MEVENRLVSLTKDEIGKEIKVKPKKNIASWCSENWSLILSELMSTASLLLFGCMTCVPIDGSSVNPPLFETLGFGLIVLINIQIFGHISGAYMNPAITVAAIIFGNISIALGTAYIIAQCVGAIIGYGILTVISPTDLSHHGVCATQPHANHTVYQALSVEILLTGILVLVACSVWDPINEKKNVGVSTMFGLTVAGVSISSGPFNGAGMNPARSLGPAVWTKIWRAHWVYWVGPFLGGTLAVLLYKYVWLRTEKVDEREALSRTGSRNRFEDTSV